MFGEQTFAQLRTGFSNEKDSDTESKLLIWLHLSARLVNRDKDLDLDYTGQFGHTHKDLEKVYKLSRVKDCAPKTRPYKSWIKTKITCPRH